mmetsp:Transcript_5656/g.12396  ORF Transcript_5656/g.12396 Transcript_5656/m.12396 type:complete len:284 (+) Transcript_5656:1096-1947(+)
MVDRAKRLIAEPLGVEPDVQVHEGGRLRRRLVEALVAAAKVRAHRRRQQRGGRPHVRVRDNGSRAPELLAVLEADAHAAALLHKQRRDLAPDAHRAAVLSHAPYQSVDDCAGPADGIVHLRTVGVEVGKHKDHRRGDRAVRPQPREGEREEVEPVAQEGICHTSAVENSLPRPGEKPCLDWDLVVCEPRQPWKRCTDHARVGAEGERGSPLDGTLHRRNELAQSPPLGHGVAAAVLTKHALKVDVVATLCIEVPLFRIHAPAIILYPVRRLVDGVQHLAKRIR